MELKVSVSEAMALIKEVENVPAKILEYIGMNIQKEAGILPYLPSFSKLNILLVLFL